MIHIGRQLQDSWKGADTTDQCDIHHDCYYDFSVIHPLFYKLVQLMNSFLLTQVVPQPTRSPLSGSSTLIDLVLVSSPTSLSSCEVIPPLANSDHDGVEIWLKWHHSQTTPKPRNRHYGDTLTLTLTKQMICCLMQTGIISMRLGT